MEEEKFHPLKRLPNNFEITKKGKVRNKLTGTVLTTFIKQGYDTVRLSYEGKRQKVRLARLITETFIPNPHNQRYVCSKDEDKLNYSLDNLYWSNKTPKKEIEKLSKGEKFGELTVIKDLGMVNKQHSIKCKCSCGKEKMYTYTHLNTGKKVDCGHVYKEIIPDLDIPKVNNRILKIPEVKRYVIKEISSKRKTNGKIKRKVRVKCRSCGDESEVDYKGFEKKGKYSCYSCSKEEGLLGQKLKTHGLSKHPLHRKFKGMLSRCHNEKSKDYKYYGARGIKVCKEWRNDFKSFYNWAITNGWGYHLTIDRIDNDGNYEPSNCRWVGRDVQSRNQSTTKLDWDKVEYIRASDKSNKDLAEKFEVSPSTIRYVRLFKTWKSREAF